MTLKERVELYLNTNELYTVADVFETFPDENKNSLKTTYYRYKDNLKESKKLQESKENLESITKVRLEDIEPLIAKELTKGYNQQVIRLALDLIKLKQVDEGIDDDIDISGYIKKAQEVLGDITIET